MNTSARKWGTFAICLLAALVPNIDLTALNQAVPHLSADLDPSATQILWIADAYGFTLAGLLITMGGVGDRIGHKKLLLMGTALFAAASAVTAYAPSAELLIAARALLGVAGATLMPSGLSLIRRAFPDPKERTAVVGAFSGVAGLAVGLGPVVAGALLDHFWWGSVFMINVPIMAVVLVAGLVVLPESRNPAPGRLDLVSVPLSVAGVLGAVYAIKEAAAHGLDETRVYVALAIGVAALAAFLVRQTRTAHPLIDVRLFRRAAFAGSVATNMFAMFTLVAQSLIFSLFFQLALGWSPLKAGLAGLPGAAGAMIGGALLAPPLIGALGRARVVAAGMLLSAVGFSLYLVIGLHTSYWLMLPSMLLAGLGMGLAMTVTADTVLASVPKERSGSASAIAETATELGGALGMAVLGSVLTAVYRNVLDLPGGVPAPAAAAARDSLAAALQAAAHLPSALGAQVATAAREAFVDGMHAALVCSAGFAAAVAVFALVTLRGVPKVIEDAEEPDLVPLP
ncbi:MFS transporter, DHA2 family, multidrug resistance protein [Actinomadura meyerae]|jgi:DHA2 family multidrug resistance protein-like MFS transporter|uniref:MFS transporter, DHA2 family, multidrug resistance protein n=1 Tax=Actinomadura meyerae TaxID=240840 RepID=A0A239EGW3_9ACTN|nr:MFS transporter [Actinomadura meyerae]SNS43895.1 MFS transporter, DHA2 family, multidrug resistance protein [Actinomadura meyerae]